jgi:hypothetical protein
MAYIFHQDDLPRLVSVTPGRERTFFVNQELAGIDDALVDVIRYANGASSPLHYHINCEHFISFWKEKARSRLTKAYARSIPAN